MSDNASAWLSAVDGLADVHARLRRVVVENLPALEVIRREDGPGTLFYCDPPYLHETRATVDAYAFEMTEADHRELLELKDERTAHGNRIKGLLANHGLAMPVVGHDFPERLAELRLWDGSAVGPRGEALTRPSNEAIQRDSRLRSW